MSKYCVECGTKLMEQAKFCYQCGTKVLNDKEMSMIPESENYNEDFKDVAEKTEVDTAVIKIEAEPFSINLFGTGLELSQEYSNLKFVRDYFYDYAVKNVDKLKDYIEGNVRCCDDIYERAIPFSINCINAAYENAVEIAYELGITYIDYDCIVLAIDEKNSYDSYFSYYYEKVQVIEEYARSLSSYRGLQRIKNAKWYGGGFGIKNAIKGHIKATALNLGTDIIREISNSITDSRDREKIQKVKELIYRDVNMRENMYLIVYHCSFSPFYLLIQELEKKGIIQIPFINEKIVISAKEAFESYLLDNEKSESVKKKIEEAIKEQPLNALFYVYLELLEPEAVDEIMGAVNLLGIDFEYKIEKKGLLKLMFEEVKNIDEETALSIQKKGNILEVLQKIKYGKKEELQSLRRKLSNELGKIIQLMAEYELEELELKLSEYKKFYKGYEGDVFSRREYEKDIKRLESKYKEKRLEHEDIELLPCLEMGMIEIKKMVKEMKSILARGDYEQLWDEADKQNGYAQALLFDFYINKVRKLSGKIHSIEDILVKFIILNKKITEENSLAKFIYAVIKTKIALMNSLTSNKENGDYIYIEYLHDLHNAINWGIVYAKYCITNEYLFKKDKKIMNIIKNMIDPYLIYLEKILDYC